MSILFYFIINHAAHLLLSSLRRRTPLSTPNPPPSTPLLESTSNFHTFLGGAPCNPSKNPSPEAHLSTNLSGCPPSTAPLYTSDVRWSCRLHCYIVWGTILLCSCTDSENGDLLGTFEWFPSLSELSGSRRIQGSFWQKTQTCREEMDHKRIFPNLCTSDSPFSWKNLHTRQLHDQRSPRLCAHLQMAARTLSIGFWREQCRWWSCPTQSPAQWLPLCGLDPF